MTRFGLPRLAFAAALLACDSNPYHAVGCTTTHPLPSTSGGPDRGIVCVASDSANDTPLCQTVAAAYIAKEHPPVDFGVIVHRRSLDSSACKVHYEATGQVMGDLAGVE